MATVMPFDLPRQSIDFMGILLGTGRVNPYLIAIIAIF
jgi:hypothetical protein